MGIGSILPWPGGQDSRVARLQALLVDVGGTLIRDDTWLPLADYRRRMAERIAALYHGGEAASVRVLLAHPFAVDDAPSYEHGVEDEVAAFLAERDYAPSRDEIARISRACALPLREVVEVEPDARAALEDARRLGLRIAICSHTLWRNDDDSRRDWTEVSMADLIDVFVSSNGTGFAKPHPRIFERALQLLDARPEAAAMVGDQLSRDIAGAKALASGRSGSGRLGTSERWSPNGMWSSPRSPSLSRSSASGPPSGTGAAASRARCARRGHPRR